MVRSLTREAIVAAATVIVDQAGPTALTMRAVAAHLGCGAMSLYRHVADRDELLDLVLQHMLGEVEVPPPTGDWRADVGSLAVAMRAALLRRPNLTILLTSRAGRGAADLATLDHALGVFLRAGFTPRDAARCNHALGNYVAGAALWEAVGLEGARGADRSARAQAAAAAIETLPVGTYPAIVAAGRAIFSGTADERFEFGLACLVDGFAARLG